MNNYKLNGFTILILLSLSACSMKDRTQAHSVSVQLPSVWANSSTLNVLNNSSSVMSINYNAPTTLGSFQCYGLNVTGPGIQSDSRMGCTDPASGMGMIAGFVPVSSGRIEMMVPAGGNRKVELVGIQSDVGCPILDALLASGGREALGDLGHPYILGSSVVDIFDDTAVTIVASFDPTKKAFAGCGDEQNGGAELSFRVPGNINLVQAGYCSPIKVEGSNPPNASVLSVLPTVVTPAISGSTDFYDYSMCASPVSTPIPLPTPNGEVSGYYKEFYVKSTGTAGQTFSVNIATATSGWTSSTPVTFTLVQDRISLGGANGIQLTNTCLPISLTSYNGPASPGGTLGDLVIKVNKFNNTASTLKIFPSSTDCTNNTSELTGVLSNGEKTFTALQSNYAGLSTSGFSFYLKNPSAEKISLTFSRLNATAQPASWHLDYMPFTSGYVSGLKGVRTQTHSLTIPIDSLDPASTVTGVMLGSTVCGSFIDNTTSVTCTVPTNAVAEKVPLKLVITGAGAGVHETQYMGTKNYYEFGNLPVVLASQTINVILGNNTNSPVIVNTTEFPNCASTLPAGLWWNSGCVIGGTATVSGTSNVSVTPTDTFGSGFSEFVMINVISVAPTFNMPTHACTVGCSALSSTTYSIINGISLNMNPLMSGALPTGCIVTSGVLPIGVYMNPDCSLYGTPSDAIGNYTVTIQPTNAYYSPASQNITFVLSN